MRNICKCGTTLVQEQTKIWDTHARADEKKYTICDNWTCLKCGKVYLNSEIEEYNLLKEEEKQERIMDSQDSENEVEDEETDYEPDYMALVKDEQFNK